MRVYLDNAATTPVEKEVVKIMSEVMLNTYGNPSSIHLEGRTARAAIENARKQVANFIGASVGEIFFTSGGTEFHNMILQCAIRDLGVRRIISSPIEHHCITHTLEHLKSSREVEINWLNIDRKGRPDLSQLKELLSDQHEKTMVSLMHSNNEIGTMIDLDEVSIICKEHNALFHTDTVQTIGYFPIDTSTTNIDFLAGSAHKFHGPKGVGFLYMKNESSFKPFMHGGSQERSMRAGTENISGIVGLAAALDLSCRHMVQNKTYIEDLRQYLKERLWAHFTDIQFNGDYDGCYHYKVLSVSFPPSQKSELMLLNLDINGISASGGSACVSGAEGGSHVLTAIQADPNRKTIRFSFSHHNTKEEIDYLIKQLKSIIPVREEVG